MELAKAIHAMVRVLNETRSVAFYKEAFDLDVADRLDFDSFTLAYLRKAEDDFEIELTINKSRDTAYDIGDGYGHIAFVVDDLDAEHARFEKAGLEPRKLIDFEHEGALLARFFFVTDPDGYEIEVMQRHGRYQ
jgi:lactoylglutathione lyase